MRITWSAVSAIALSCLIGSVADAQTATPTEATPPATSVPEAPAPAPLPAPAPTPAVVPNGTLIAVEFTELVSTRTAKSDDWFGLKLAEPVMLNNVIVIPVGTPGKGVVIDAGKPGMGGKPGKLVLSARYLEFEGRQIPIRGLKMSMNAKDNAAASVAAGVVVGVFGLAVTGGHMEVQPGTRAVAKLGADFVPTAPAIPASAPQPDAVAPPATPQTSQ